MNPRTLAVPALMVGHLRTGLYIELDAAAEEIATALEAHDREQHPERLTGPHERFDRAGDLLKLIGWRASPTPVDAHVDLREHGQALLAALRAQRRSEDDALCDAPSVDAERAGRGEPPLREATLRRVEALRRFVDGVEAQVAAALPIAERDS